MLKDYGLGMIVEKPSENWPNGALSFKNAKKDDYGYYLDVKLKGEQAKKISFLINNTAGKKSDRR